MNISAFTLHWSILKYIGVHGLVDFSNRSRGIYRFPWTVFLDPLPATYYLSYPPYPLEGSSAFVRSVQQKRTNPAGLNGIQLSVPALWPTGAGELSGSDQA